MTRDQKRIIVRKAQAIRKLVDNLYDKREWTLQTSSGACCVLCTISLEDKLLETALAILGYKLEDEAEPRQLTIAFDVAYAVDGIPWLDNTEPKIYID